MTSSIVRTLLQTSLWSVQDYALGSVDTSILPLSSGGPRPP